MKCMGTLHWLGMPQAAEELGDDLEAAREAGQEELKRWLHAAFDARRITADTN
jgi:hypothetical protein